MQFTPENCELVLSGRKTMTRRVVKPDEVMWFDGESMTVLLPRKDQSGKTAERRLTKWKVGKTYAVQSGRGKKSVGRIVITDIRREKLQDISIEDAEREGYDCGNRNYADVYPFIKVWDGLYGNDPVKGWEANPDVWVISFELVK